MFWKLGNLTKKGGGGHLALRWRRRKTWKVRVESVIRESLKWWAKNLNDKRRKGGNEVREASVNYFFKMCGKEEKGERMRP